ncbi:MAG: hypothetical protein ACE5IF_04775 [Candidatus Bathyarchaeia archaeon]
MEAGLSYNDLGLLDFFGDMLGERLIIRYFLIIRTDLKAMGDETHHSRLAKEKREAALDEFSKGRYTVVGDMALKAVEQAIEAVASREGEHFHLSPRTAHALRVKWAKENFPQISTDLDVVWSAYGDLGYDGLDGNRAREAVEAMERIIGEIERRSGIRFR